MSWGGYLRISTADQNEAGQRRDVLRWLAGQGVDQAAVKWFTDTESRDTLTRPGLKALQSAVFHGKIKTIVVADVTRLAGTIVDGVNLLHGWLSQGVRLVSVRQEVDFASTTGMMVASLLFGLSQAEQETRRRRQKAGIAAAKEAGIYKGRKPGTLKGSPARARALHAKGLTVAEVAASLGVSARTARRYIGQAAIPTA